MVSQPREVTLADALEALQSDKLEDRRKGVEILKEVLTYNRNDRNLQKLNEKSIHAIFEALFRANSGERANFVRGTKSVAKTTSASRLGTGASVLRLTVSLFVDRLKKKTVKALLRHITEALPTADGRFCEPLALDYLKALRATLEYPPHVEHLEQGAWIEAVDFCLGGLGTFEALEPDDDELPSSKPQSTPYRSQVSALWKESRAGTIENIVELLGSLHSLLVIPSVPLASKALDGLSTALRFLKSSPSVTAGHYSAVQIVNVVLAHIKLNATVSVSQFALDILSVVRTLWSRTKTEYLLADELLISIKQLQGYLTTLKQSSQVKEYTTELEALLHVMQTEYCSFREEKRGHLEFGDIGFHSLIIPEFATNPMQLSSLHLRRCTAKSERNWVELETISFLISWIDTRPATVNTVESNVDHPVQSSKRARRTLIVEDLIEQVGSKLTQQRIYVLQILNFLLDQFVLDSRLLRNMLEQLLDCISHQNPEVSSWALVTLARCAYQERARSDSVKILWLKVWSLALRLISSLPHCRAACHLVDVLLSNACIQYAEVSETLDAVFSSATVNGPASICDSALDIWSSISRIKADNYAGTKTSVEHEYMLSWLYSKWSPSNCENRQYCDRLRREVRPSQIHQTFHRCITGQDKSAHLPPFTELGVLGQAWLGQWMARAPLNYLLHNKLGDESRASISKLAPVTSEPVGSSVDHSEGSLELLLRFATVEVNALDEVWNTTHRSTTANADMVHFLSSFCLSNLAVLPNINLSTELASKVNHLRKSLNTIIVKVTDTCFKPHTSRNSRIAALLEAWSEFLPDISRRRDHSGFEGVVIALAEPLRYMDRALRDFSEEVSSTTSGFRTDGDILDAFPTSENSQQRLTFTDHSARLMPAALAGSESFRASVATYIAFAADCLRNEDVANTSLAVPTSFVRHLCSLSSSEFLASAVAIDTIIKSSYELKAADAETLLVQLANAFLAPYSWSRCESSIWLCLKIMLGTLPLWTDERLESMAEAGADMYIWFIEATTQGQLSSPNVQMAVVDLLYALLKLKPYYGQSTTSPSVRTNLFNILKEGEVRVQYHIAIRLTSVFDNFSIDQHEVIFSDVYNSLPEDVRWMEGIYIRLLILTNLGATYTSLLRRCLYHIFEVAGLVPAVHDHARAGVKRLAEALSLTGPRELFTLSAPQLLWSWLESQSLESIPFSIFAYNSLKELVLDVQGEIFGQSMLRITTGLGKELELITGISNEEMLADNFALVATYGIVKDVSTISPQEKVSHDVESRIRGMLGKDAYIKAMADNIHIIISCLFQHLEDEDQMERAFSKRTGYEQPLAILQEIQQLNSSTKTLPSSQQPHFKAKAVLEALERICRRVSNASGKDSAKKDERKREDRSFWTSICIVSVARMLLDGIHPIHGSFHACRVLRRVRLVLSLSEAKAVSGYPLEMLLHAVHPLTADEHCGDEAMGIIQYLLRHGMRYLVNNVSFVAELCLSLYLSFENILQALPTPSSSDKDDSAIMNRLQAFRAWLSTWLDTFDAANPNSAMVTKFQAMMDLARRFDGTSTLSHESVKGQLLLLMFDDSASQNRILSQGAFESCFKLMIHDFSAPIAHTDGLIGDDELATRYSIPIWKSIDFSSMNPAYLSWSARVLGRTFGETGAVAGEIFAESRFKRHTSICKASNSLLRSKGAILQFMTESLRSSTSKTVGLAESALQRTLLHYISAQDNELLKECVAADAAAAIKTLSSRLPILSSYVKQNESNGVSLKQCIIDGHKQAFSEWISDLTTALTATMPHEPLFMDLPAFFSLSRDNAEKLFPFVLHIVLVTSLREKNGVREDLSEAIGGMLTNCTSTSTPYLQAILNGLLYLRGQQFPGEVSPFDRNDWLQLDPYAIANAATFCNMPRSALLFLDIADAPRSKSSKSRVLTSPPNTDELLLKIFDTVDEPDSFYGVKQPASIEAIIKRQNFESNGIDSLVFRSAQIDSLTRSRALKDIPLDSALITPLSMLNLNTLVRALTTNQLPSKTSATVSEGVLRASLRLGQWDLPTTTITTSSESLLYRTFQSIQFSDNSETVMRNLDIGLLDCLDRSRKSGNDSSLKRSSFKTLAALTEVYDILVCRSKADVDGVMEKLKAREQWMSMSQPDTVIPMLTSRSALTNMLSSNAVLQHMMKLDSQHALLLETDNELRTSRILRQIGALNESLSSSTYLADIVPSATKSGLHIEGAVKNELANVLWARGELVTAVQMLRDVADDCDFSAQSLPIARAEILATLGQRISYARLEDPTTIGERYLGPALIELRGETHGPAVAHTFHEYAAYCHNQLTSGETLEEFQRIERFKRQKEADVRELKEAMACAKSKSERAQAERAMREAQRWLKLDNQEYDRLRAIRANFLSNSLSNYLKALTADDTFDSDVIKFTALWFENFEDEDANESVKAAIDRVPTRKFAPLMNQFSSRLQDEKTKFQISLANIIQKVCHDHPYHGMYQVAAGSKTSGGSDSQGISRKQGATSIAAKLIKDPSTTKLWTLLTKANELYNKMAKFKSDELRQMSKVPLKNYDTSRRVERDVPQMKVPPITASIDIRENFDYSAVPYVAKFSPEMSILGGISAPKLLTVTDSAGRQLRQLFKGGSDDLRQDAIMEQVFEQVTELLRQNKQTRQRNLRIRTYKVVPLDANSGAIEFVQPTIPLLEFLQGGHQKYHPNDYNWRTCRDKIEKVSEQPQAQRVKVFRDICARFAPVLRHFFFERFEDPDDWFERRLAYTRSTAAISILGHVLGLGDRHCQNILLDTETGEVVHIDLGVAFDAGRILPKPETVPFRLTRDIVDGFGVLKTEGVFRRCCGFTLEALRQNKDTILTLLNVLRYDPLYNWSVSPLRAKRLQAEQQQAAAAEASMTVTARSRRSSTMDVTAEEVEEQKRVTKKREEESGEADRALSVVERKLGAGLSVTAAVSELIQQATDERNLAVLYHGWAAYA